MRALPRTRRARARADGSYLPPLSSRSFLLDAARRSLTSHLSLAAALERTTSPERELTPMPTPVKPEPAEARIAGPVPPTGNEPVRRAGPSLPAFPPARASTC